MRGRPPGGVSRLDGPASTCTCMLAVTPDELAARVGALCSQRLARRTADSRRCWAPGVCQRRISTY